MTTTENEMGLGVIFYNMGLLVLCVQTSIVELISLVVALPYQLFFYVILIGVPLGILVGSVDESRGRGGQPPQTRLTPVRGDKKGLGDNSSHSTVLQRLRRRTDEAIVPRKNGKKHRTMLRPLRTDHSVSKGSNSCQVASSWLILVQI